ncbi:MAG TPA: MOSC domain-containing protein [Gaiellaceae bacterium]|jgi:hypothetical protein
MAGSDRIVSRIAIAPVRGFSLEYVPAVELTEDGVVENRRFMLVDAEGNRLRSSLTSWPVVVSGRYDVDAERLSMAFPDGTECEGSALDLGDEVFPVVASNPVPSLVVEGPWTEPLSRLAGHPVRVARPERPGAAKDEPVTILSQASVDRLSEVAGHPVDDRRFRMLFTVTGCSAHEEDEWNGRSARFGDAVVRVGGPVPRCAVTTRDPDTGERDLDTLRLIRSYRGVRDGDAIDFGVFGTVEEPGRVRLGDPVELL